MDFLTIPFTQNANLDNILSRTFSQRRKNMKIYLAGAHTKKFFPYAPTRAQKATKYALYPYSGAYTEKKSRQIPFFVISGAQGDNFLVYAPSLL